MGRLDFNSEGLLILTNNGDFSRFLELPSNQFLRTYKVRVHGNIDKERNEIEKQELRKLIYFNDFINSLKSFSYINL